MSGESQEMVRTEWGEAPRQGRTTRSLEEGLDKATTGTGR